MKWAVLPGLILALLANLFQLLGRWAFVDPVSVYNTERPLRWIERLIWPQQWIFYTPYTTASDRVAGVPPTVQNGPPDWLALVFFLGLVDIGAIRCGCVYRGSCSPNCGSSVQESSKLTPLRPRYEGTAVELV
jgi:hypothetical protein